jgi:hypothetical protein
MAAALIFLLAGLPDVEVNVLPPELPQHLSVRSAH